MNKLTTLTAIALLGATTPALSQVNIPNPQAPGNSPESAVRLVVTSEVMVDRAITRWLRQHYPGWDADPHEITEIGMERYAIVRISSPNNDNRRIYFRLLRHQNEEDSGFPQF